MIEYRAYQFFLRRGDVRPESMLGLYNLVPLLFRRDLLFRQAVIEESFDGCFLAFIVVWVIRDEAHKTTCWGLVGFLAGELRSTYFVHHRYLSSQQLQ
jgi:hypothetical protein